MRDENEIDVFKGEFLHGFCFEDIQWINNGSLRILGSKILHCNTNILCSMTFRKEYIL